MQSKRYQNKSVQSLKTPSDLVLLYESLQQLRDVQLVLRIRFDPNLQSVCAQAPELIEDSPGNLFLLKWHWYTLNTFSEYFKFDFSLNLEEFREILMQQVERFLPSHMRHELVLKVSPDGTTQLTSLELQPRLNVLSGISGQNSEIQYELYVDNTITCISPYTTFPIHGSPPIERARNRLADIYNSSDKTERTDSGTNHDIIMINSSHEVIGGTEVNMAFFRLNRWVSPSLASGSQLDATQMMLRSSAFIKEDSILVSDLRVGEEVLVYNSVIGIARGKIMSVPKCFIAAKKRKVDRPSSKAKAMTQEIEAERTRASTNLARLTSERIRQATVQQAKSPRKRQKRDYPGSGVFKF